MELDQHSLLHDMSLSSRRCCQIAVIWEERWLVKCEYYIGNKRIHIFISAYMFLLQIYISNYKLEK